MPSPISSISSSPQYQSAQSSERSSQTDSTPSAASSQPAASSSAVNDQAPLCPGADALLSSRSENDHSVFLQSQQADGPGCAEAVMEASVACGAFAGAAAATSAALSNPVSAGVGLGLGFALGTSAEYCGVKAGEAYLACSD